MRTKNSSFPHMLSSLETSAIIQSGMVLGDYRFLQDNGRKYHHPTQRKFGGMFWLHNFPFLWLYPCMNFFMRTKNSSFPHMLSSLETSAIIQSGMVLGDYRFLQDNGRKYHHPTQRKFGGMFWLHNFPFLWLYPCICTFYSSSISETIIR